MTSKISDALARLPPEAQYFSLEFFPPKTAEGLQNLFPRLQRLRALRPLFVCVTFSAGASTASIAKTLQLADICQNSLGFRTCLHLTCTNSSRLVIDGVLDEARRLGIRNILALRGDEPRPGEYAAGHSRDEGSDGGEPVTFSYAVDLIRHIRRQHGDHFCIGAAAYPEGHPVVSAAHAGGYHQSPLQDVPHLRDKVRAGADFLLSQLFYDGGAFLDFERLLRRDDSGVFDGIPLIPGFMPVQGWQSFTRTSKLARVALPADVKDRLARVRGDDEGVKRVGVDIVSELVERIRREGHCARQGANAGPQGFHFYTLNLEKAVAQILERCNLLPSLVTSPTDGAAVDDDEAISYSTSRDVSPFPRRTKRRQSSAHNRVVVGNDALSPLNADYGATETRAGKPRRPTQTGDDVLAIAEGEGSLGRAATWDDFPNGRWGDARSPGASSESDSRFDLPLLFAASDENRYSIRADQ